MQVSKIRIYKKARKYYYNPKYKSLTSYDCVIKAVKYFEKKKSLTCSLTKTSLVIISKTIVSDPVDYKRKVNLTSYSEYREESFYKSELRVDSPRIEFKVRID